MCRSTPKGCVSRKVCLRQLSWRNYDMCVCWGRYSRRKADRCSRGSGGTHCCKSGEGSWTSPLPRSLPPQILVYSAHIQTQAQKRDARIRNKSDKLCFSFRPKTGLAAVKQKRKEERGLMKPAGENFSHQRELSLINALFVCGHIYDTVQNRHLHNLCSDLISFEEFVRVSCLHLTGWKWINMITPL